MTVYALTGVIAKVESLPPCETVCALGLFDGVHRGHAHLLAKTVALAKARGAVPIVWCLPSACYKGAGDLCTLAEKLTLFAKCGIAYAVVQEFEAVRTLSAQAFVRDMVATRLSAVIAVCGEDFRFGHGGVGTASLLKDLMKQAGRDAYILEKLQDDATHTPISANVIRRALEEGQIEYANALLGYDFSVCGTVTEGKKLGRKLGFPTANVTPAQNKLLPPFGVYACMAELEGDRQLAGVCNIGRNPTTDRLEVPRLEIHLFCEDMPEFYGQTLCVRLKKMLRREKTFASVEELKREIDKNVQEAKAYLGE